MGNISGNSFVSVVHQLIILVLTRFFLNHKLNNEKEVHMKQYKKFNNLINSSINSILETLWAIGTSITASAVPIIFQYVNEHFLYIDKYIIIRQNNTKWLTAAIKNCRKIINFGRFRSLG